jgi:hypothetical protein
MVYRTRIKYTAAQKADIWNRWQRGESLNSIGRLFDRPSSSVFNMLAPTGGIRPPPLQRSRLALTLAEREEISRGLACRLSLRAIATQLGRSPSTISRELHRNGGATGYRAVKADQAAWDRARCPKRCKLACNRSLSRTIVTNGFRSQSFTNGQVFIFDSAQGDRAGLLNLLFGNGVETTGNLTQELLCLNARLLHGEGRVLAKGLADVAFVDALFHDEAFHALLGDAQGKTLQHSIADKALVFFLGRLGAMHTRYRLELGI